MFVEKLFSALILPKVHPPGISEKDDKSKIVVYYLHERK